MRKRLRYLTSRLPQSLIVRTTVLQVPSPLSWKDRHDEQNEVSIIQGEIISKPLHHLDAHKSIRLDEIHPRVLRELVGELTKPTSIDLPAVLANHGVLS